MTDLTLDHRIPEIDRDPDDGHVVIRDCGELLVRLTEAGRVRLAPAYHQRGYASATSEILVRAGVADGLQRAARALPDDVYLLVWDGLRTLETQREIIDRFRASLSHLQATDRDELCRRYVSPLPATPADYRKAPPPHTTGAAVDVTLCDRIGIPLDLGADFDEFNDVAWLTFFEMAESEAPTSADRIRRNRRRALYWAMTGAGFAAYNSEYWHYELGTRRAAATAGCNAAIYGGIAPWPVGWTQCI